MTETSAHGIPMKIGMLNLLIYFNIGLRRCVWDLRLCYYFKFI